MHGDSGSITVWDAYHARYYEWMQYRIEYNGHEVISIEYQDATGKYEVETEAELAIVAPFGELTYRLRGRNDAR